MKKHYAQKIINSRYTWIASTLISFVMAQYIFAYKGAEHTDIGQRAINNYMTYAGANLDTCVGTNALMVYRADILNTIVSEDDSNPYGDDAPYLRHFYDPVTGNGLYLFPNRYDSALTRANAYWNTFALPNYRDGNYHEAYLALGRVMHLVMDMGVPAHVNLDRHPASDFYESNYVRTPGNRVHETTISTASDLTTIMRTLALASRNFDSDDVDGLVDLGTRRAGGFTAVEGAGVAQVCYPGAEKAAGGVIKLFYDTIKPTVQFIRPAEGEVHSGLNGVPFEAKAKSYDKQFTDADFIDRVDFDYSEVDSPGYNAWKRAVSIAKFNADSKYTFNWKSSVDDDKVWVSATAIDKGDCESLSGKTWIRIDSTRPKVSNNKP